MGTFGLTPSELRTLRALDTPRKVQDFLDRVPQNFERGGDSCLSPRMVLRERRAHCIEGAMLADVALRLQGRPPLVVDLEASDDDHDHVIAVFKERGRWGAISKTNHAVLRWREPVYASVRELVMSYFHEYFTHAGKKTLRAFSRPVDLRRFDRRGWMTAEEDVWYVPEFLCDVAHEKILLPGQAARLRRADAVEIRAGKILEWRKK
jgi:hypothetical protein